MSETVLENGKPTVPLIAAEGGNATFSHTDVSDGAAVAAMVAEASRRTERLDVIVNNACIPPRPPPHRA